MQQLGFEPHVINVPGDITWEFERFAFEEAGRLLERRTLLPSRTILCAHDRIAFGVIAAAFQKGIRVGHGADYDLRVAGHDDHPLARYACPPITTVAQNYNEIGRLSIELLFQKLNEEADDATRMRERILLSADLMLRKSA
jgi:DNA-binding LacI/PurR family transcriptional regulator